MSIFWRIRLGTIWKSYSFGGLGFADVASNGITWEVAEKE